MKLRRISRALLATAATAVMSFSTLALAQSPAAPETATATSWTTEQLVTSTVHDAWLLSGKDETKFFEMVKTLTELSAQKRGITLPDTEAAGTRMGAAIKRMAKADTDQLLYVVVDKAVLQTAHAKPVPAGTRGKATPTAQ